MSELEAEGIKPRRNKRLRWLEIFYRGPIGAGPLVSEPRWVTTRRTQPFQQGPFVWNVPAFDERAVREVLLNAVSHRDYRHTGSVFVRQYPRRVEIVSPKGFPPGIVQQNLLWEQTRPTAAWARSWGNTDRWSVLGKALILFIERALSRANHCRIFLGPANIQSRST